jgi:peptidoglycan/xylan/chitin deacetylase (PgdA/CDA1 family)
MRRSTTLVALLGVSIVLVTGAGIALAQGGAELANGPTGALAAVAQSAAAGTTAVGIAATGTAATGTAPTGALSHVLQAGSTASPTVVTVPDLPTTEAAPIQRPTQQAELGTATGSATIAAAVLPTEAPTAPQPAAGTPAETVAAAEPPAPAPEPAPAAPQAAFPDVPVVAPYGTVLGWHGSDRVAYLTFDDGPGPSTERVLDILARAGVKATFCVIGQRVTDNPGLTARVAAEGHTLCNHSWDHYSPFDGLSPETLDQEITLTQNAIQQATGVAPRYLRAPEGRFGAPGGAVLQAGQRARTIPLGWGVDSLDWQKPGTAGIVANVLSTVSPGAIILLHDGGGADREETIAALPAIITGLQAAGYTLAAMPPDAGG